MPNLSRMGKEEYVLPLENLCREPFDHEGTGPSSPESTRVDRSDSWKQAVEFPPVGQICLQKLREYGSFLCFKIARGDV